jgi:excisionase family DNA binding protein
MMVTSQINTEAEPMSPRIAQSPVMTDDEVAEFLRVSKEVVQQEISSGKLPALRIGSEWRIVRKDFEQFLRTQTTQPKAKSQNGGPQSIIFSPAKPFDHRWPEKKGQPKTPEHFDEAYAATANTSTGMKKILVGFSFGKVDKRRKSTVFVDGRPVVRFKAADDFDKSGLMLSIIKMSDRKQLRPDEPVPPEYSAFRIEQYRAHIDQTYNSKNMAVVCDKADLQTMAAHALIRTEQIEERKQ